VEPSGCKPMANGGKGMSGPSPHDHLLPSTIDCIHLRQMLHGKDGLNASP
jgi:hypothetical protein